MAETMQKSSSGKTGDILVEKYPFKSIKTASWCENVMLGWGGAAHAIKSSKWRFKAVFAAVAILLAPSAVLAQQTHQYEQAGSHAIAFNLPAQSLEEALQAFSRQMPEHLQLVYDSALIAGKQAPALQGTHNPHDALKQLLAGSGIVVTGAEQGLITLGLAPTVQTANTAHIAHRTSAAANLHTLPEIVVSEKAIEDVADYRPEYAAKQVTVASKIPLTLRETPHSVTVMTEKRLDDQRLTETTQALTWVPGLWNYRTYMPETPFITSRGTAIDTVTIDGSLAGTGSLSLPADLAAYEQVEVVRGPAGLFYGNGGGGSAAGVVNMVRKRPGYAPHIYIDLSAGSWNQYKTSLDINRPLNQDGSLRSRMIVSHQDREFFYRTSELENTTAHGLLEYDFRPGLTLTGGLEYTRRRSIPQASALPLYGDGRLPGWSRSVSNVLPWSSWETDTMGGFLELNWKINDDWKFKSNYSYSREQTYRDYATVSGYLDPLGSQYPLYMNGYWGDLDRRGHTLDLSLQGKFTLWGREHDVVVGADSYWERDYQQTPSGSANYSYDWNGNRVLVTDFLDLSGYPGRPSIVNTETYHYPYDRSGAFANIRLRLTDDLSFITGMRVSSYDYGGQNTATIHRRNAYKESGIRTPYYALTYDFAPRSTAFVSFAEVFSVTNAYTVGGDRVHPQTGENIELGIKQEWFDNLQASLSIYQLDRRYATRVDPDAPYPCPASPTGGYCYIADNERRTRGVDFELSGRITPSWQLSASVNWLQKKYTTWKDRYGEVSSTEGQTWWTDEPARVMKLWSTYRLPGQASAWTVGGGFRANSEIFMSRSASGAIPAYTVRQGGHAIWDVMVAWNISPRWTAQLNVTNLFDRKYLSMVSTGSHFYGEPRGAMFSLKGRF